MTIVRRPSPFGELLSLRQAMDRLFEDSFVRPTGWGQGAAGTALPVNVSTTSEELVVEAALPGIRPDDVDITVEDGTLTIRGETASVVDEGDGSDGGEYLVREIRRGSFVRSMSLPAGLEPDRAVATFDNGVLTLRIPRAEEVRPRQIRISPTVDGSPDPNGSRSPEGAEA